MIDHIHCQQKAQQGASHPIHWVWQVVGIDVPSSLGIVLPNRGNCDLSSNADDVAIGTPRKPLMVEVGIEVLEDAVPRIKNGTSCCSLLLSVRDMMWSTAIRCSACVSNDFVLKMRGHFWSIPFTSGMIVLLPVFRCSIANKMLASPS